MSNTTPSGTSHLVYDTAGRLLAEANGISGATVREYVWLEIDDEGVERGPTSRPDNDNDRSGAGGRLGAAETDNDPSARAQLPSLNGPRNGLARRAVPLAVIADVDTATPKTFYVHADHLDRPIRMTDQSQALVWDAQYKPYGEVQAITGSASMDARFPGQWFQLETGLHYNWHRHYDPTTGRYLQPDPLGLVDGPSVYAYANSSPQMGVDREGLQQGISIPRPGNRSSWGMTAITAFLELCRRGFGGGGGGGDDESYEKRLNRENNNCLRGKWRVAHPDYTRACFERAQTRYLMCQRNGGNPDPNEPGEWRGGPDHDEETGRNFGR